MVRGGSRLSSFGRSFGFSFCHYSYGAGMAWYRTTDLLGGYFSVVWETSAEIADEQVNELYG